MYTGNQSVMFYALMILDSLVDGMQVVCPGGLIVVIRIILKGLCSVV